MKNILLILIVFGLVGCALETHHGGLQGYSRTDELLIAGYTREQIAQARANGTYEQLVQYARSSGKVQQGYERLRKEQEAHQKDMEAQRIKEWEEKFDEEQRIKLEEEIQREERLKQREQLAKAIVEEKDKSLQKELFSRLEAFKIDQRKKN